MLWGHPGVDTHVGYRLLKLWGGEVGQLTPSHDGVARLSDAQGFGDRLGGQRVIAGNHHRANACPATVSHGLSNLRAGGV